MIYIFYLFINKLSISLSNKLLINGIYCKSTFILYFSNVLDSCDKYCYCDYLWHSIYLNVSHVILSWGILYSSKGASDRSFYPIFNKRFDDLETLLAICRPKKVLSAGSLCGPLEPSPQSKCPERTFMLPQNYHVSVSNMLSKPLKCFVENEN